MNNLVTQYLAFHGEINETRATRLITLCFEAVAKSYNEIYIAFSSTGGSVHSGIALFNFLKSIPIALTIHNLGTVDSAAVIIFLAAKRRFACKDSHFLIHEPRLSFVPNNSFNTYQLYEFAESLKDDKETMSNIICQHTSITTEFLAKWFLKGEIISPPLALELGIISEIRSLDIPASSSIITVGT